MATKGQLGKELWDIIKEVRTLQLGSNLTSFAAPASLMLPFSTTELVMLALSHSAVGFAEAVHEPDISRRMLRILAAQLAAMSHTLTAPMMKPYNPVLGELIAARGGEPGEAGTGGGSAWRAVVEQVSHHPPLTASHIEGRAGPASFRHYGTSGSVPIFRGNSVEVRMVLQPGGGTVLMLEDGTEEHYRVKALPSLCLRNVLFPTRAYCEWVGDLEVEGVTSGLFGRISFQAAKMFDSASAHRVVGAVSVGDAKIAPVICQIEGTWTGRVVATAPHGGDEIELLAALEGGVERPTGIAELPQPPPYDVPTHSLSWERHPHVVWSELTSALRESNWASARAAKRSVEEGRRAEKAAMLKAGTAWAPALFEMVALPDGDGWILRDGALDRAFDMDAEQPCRAL